MDGERVKNKGLSFLAAIIWFCFGFLFAIGIIDDAEEFSIPGTNKVFIRKNIN